MPALRLHKESEHKKKKIQCEKCRLIFYEDKKLERHKLKCVVNPSFECAQTSHFHPEGMPFQRSLCLKKFQGNGRCQRLEKKCQTKNRFECHVCRYTYPNMTFKNLQSHMCKHTGEGALHFPMKHSIPSKKLQSINGIDWFDYRNHRFSMFYLQQIMLKRTGACRSCATPSRNIHIEMCTMLSSIFKQN